MKRLDGKVALVTGGAGPLGSVLADELASLGAEVLIVDLGQTKVDLAVDRIREGRDVRCEGLAVDLTAPTATTYVAQHVKDHFGRCDVLVNNAGLTGTSGVAGYAVPFGEQTDEAFMAAQYLNLGVPFSLTRLLSPMLGANNTGSVVNVASIYGLVGPNMNLYAGTSMGNPAAYAASKGGLIQLTRYLAAVLSPTIRVNCFAPGGIARDQPNAFVERYEALTPLARMATEDDFRGVVSFLASDSSAYVTGQVIAVDGGWTAW